MDPTALGALEASPVLFRETILERLSQYELLVTREPEAALLSVHPLGSDVDRHAAIIGWIRWSIERLGLEVLQESRGG